MAGGRRAGGRRRRTGRSGGAGRNLPLISPARFYPPDRRILGATIQCGRCGHRFGRWDFPTMASLAGPTGSVSTPVPERREACPRCEEPIEDSPLIG